MKTSELTGTALDWAVAKCEGWKDWVADDEAFTWAPDGCGWLSLESYKPSTDWSQGGSIIEREGIHIGRIHAPAHMKKEFGDFYWIANGVRGQTPLIAAMRCYVASKMGTEIDVPEELNEKV